AQPLTDYMDRLAAVVRERLDDDVPKPLIGLRVVVDAGNGAGGAFAQFLENLGAETEGSQFLEPDGSFPNHAPDPSDPAALASLSKAVLAAQADLGVLFDADCDRAAFVDQSGREIAGNRLIALISAVLLAENPGATIVTDSVTSSGLTSFIAGWGGTHYRFKRGYRNVIEEARRLSEEGIDCPLAIETSGHAAFRDNHYLDDGMYLATRLICEAHDRKRFGETLSSLIDDLAEPVESCEIRFKVTDADVQQASSDAIELILSHTLDNPCWRLATDSREGVRILFNLDCGMENAWFQLRMSVHDPAMMVLNAESDVPGGVGSMLGELYVLLQDCAGIDLQPLKRALEN
ncbi:MAG: phosphomannomutase/phosphoglucomutase, partial [Christensenellales bacterium]